MKKLKPSEQQFLEMTNAQRYDECEKLVNSKTLNDQTKKKLQMCLSFILYTENIRTTNALKDCRALGERVNELEKEISKLKEKHLLREEFE